MRTLVLIGFGFLFGCGSGQGGVFGDARYQVRCPQGLGGCPGNGDVVDVFNFDGQDGVSASCRVMETSGDTRTIDLSVGIGSDPLLQVAGLVTSATGGAVNGFATVTVREDENTYGGRMFGQASGGVPSDAVPCQIDNLSINPDGPDGPEVVFSLLCRNLAAAAAPGRLQRDITQPNNSSQPAEIRMINCDGL